MSKWKKLFQSFSKRKLDSDPVRFPTYRFVYDFELCVGLSELKETIRTINDNGYNLVCVAQSEDTYTVFFRRFVSG